jgi:hypothetical protein
LIISECCISDLDQVWDDIVRNREFFLGELQTSLASLADSKSADRRLGE